MYLFCNKPNFYVHLVGAKTFFIENCRTKHGFVFKAQRKPNSRLEIYKAFQDRLTCLN